MTGKQQTMAGGHVLQMRSESECRVYQACAIHDIKSSPKGGSVPRRMRRQILMGREKYVSCVAPRAPTQK